MRALMYAALAAAIPATAAGQEIESVTPYVALASGQTLAEQSGRLMLSHEALAMIGVQLETAGRLPVPLWLSVSTGLADGTASVCPGSLCGSAEDGIHVVALAGGASVQVLPRLSARLGATARYVKFGSEGDTFSWYMLFGGTAAAETWLPISDRLGIAVGGRWGLERLAVDRLEQHLEDTDITPEAEWRSHQVLHIGLRIGG